MSEAGPRLEVWSTVNGHALVEATFGGSGEAAWKCLCGEKQSGFGNAVIGWAWHLLAVLNMLTS